jgi:PAS domain S-box-containing protein
VGFFQKIQSRLLNQFFSLLLRGSGSIVKQKEAYALRKFGLKLVGDVPWGTHLCQFYETKEDLIDILVPYFAEGLRNNEFCMWITSPPLEVEEAKQALRKAIPELDQYIQKGQIEILPYTEWYLLGGAFDADKVLQGWVEKEEVALSRGFDGLRLTGNTFWLERNGWKAFTDYEAEVNNAIGKYRMIAVCTYSLSKCNANEIIDVIKNHQYALVKRSGKWELIESAENKIIQSALQRSEKKFSALYSSMIEGVVLYDIVYDSSGKAVDYVITDVNPSYQEITGLSKNQVVGKKTSELYGTGEPPYLNVYAKVASSGKPTTFETYFPPMKKHFSISVFSSSKGKFATVFHDITERKQAEEILRQTRDYLEKLFNYANAPIICWDAKFKITRFNHAFEHLAGYKAEEVIGKDLSVLFPEEGREESLTRIQRTLTGEHWEVVEIPILRKDGGTRIVLWNSANIYAEDGKTLMATIAQGQDITERKQMQDKLEDYAKHLEELVEERTKQLKDAERLVVIGQTAGMVGHDIRNPLQSIIGDVYLAKMDLASLPDSEEKESVRESLEAIGKQTGYINKIVLDLQDFAKPLNPHAEETDIERLIEELLVRNGVPENIQTDVKVDIDAKKVMADSAYLKRIMGNLISNAIQAMPDGGKLAIRAHREVGDVVITVEDTGVGVPDQDKPKLFQPLFTTKSKGQGFGLAVVKRLTEALNGTVTFDSQEGKGTKFTIKLPLGR